MVSNKGSAREKFSWSNSNFQVLTPTFSKDEFLSSCFQNPSESSVMANTSISFW